MNVSQEIEKELERYLRSVESRCSQILEEEILNMYFAYDPVKYIRTEQLLNSVRTKIEKNKLYVYIDEGLNYYSSVDNRQVGQLIPYIVNYGHHRNIEDPIPMYDDYSGNYFIEVAAKRIKEELGLDVKIIKDKPPQV